jgi:small subunit ribosomal protein S1
MVHLSDLDWNRSGEERDQGSSRRATTSRSRCSTSTPRRSASRSASSSSPTTLRVVDRPVRQGPGGDRHRHAGAGERHRGPARRRRARLHRKSDLSRDRSDQRPDRYAVGEKLDAKITQLDRAARKVGLSVKAKDIDEEREAIAAIRLVRLGASLGDILGAALRRQRDKAKDA